MDKLGVSDLLKKYKEKAISPVEYAEYMLHKIKTQDDMNIFINVAEKEVMINAKEAEKHYMEGTQRALEGVPIAIKDIVNTKGIPTTYACAAYKNQIFDEDATILKKLDRAGYSMLGKTNTSQFALGPTGEFSYIGPCKNPHDKTRITGGSSSGSAAAVAGFFAPAAIGSDTGGSIRIPSSLCGVVGMKPTYGRVSKHGIMALSSALDTIGPITRGVKDNALILNEIAGYDALDFRCAKVATQDYTMRINESIKGAKIAVAVDWFDDEDIDEDVKKLFQNALHKFQELGAQLKEIHFPDLSRYRKAHQKMIAAGAWHACEDVIKNHKDTIYEQPWQRMLSGDFSAKEYLECEKIREEFIVIKQKLMEDCEIMLVPSTPCGATLIGAKTTLIKGVNKEILTLHPKFTWFCNFSGYPALSMPIGLNSMGLPIGISIIGHPFEEANIYRFAAQLEGVVGYGY